VDTFRFSIALPGDAESMDLLRELCSEVARSAGLDAAGARRASDELLDAIEERRRGAGKAPVNVSFERRRDSGPVDVEVTGAPAGGRDRTDVRRSWGSS
jgi:hypothetical protein